MSRGHQRKACFGRSLAAQDPLVAEIVETVAMEQSIPPGPFDSSPPLLESDMPEVDDLADLDEQLLIAACDPAFEGSEGQPGEQPDLASHSSILEVMNSVNLPTARALRTASLHKLRAALTEINEERDARLWATYHVILGAALRLRASRSGGHQRAAALIEATRSFDTAFSIYATVRAFVAANMVSALQATLSTPARTGGDERSCADSVDDALTVPLATSHRATHYRPVGRCGSECDGTSLVARAIAAPVATHGHLLERAVTCLRLARAAADIKSWTWVSSTNNLACALTLLGNRSPAAAGSAMLKEAAQVLQEALKVHAAGLRREDRASTLINLAEALLSLAERETPHMRLKKVERACAASSVALLTVIPADLAWLVRLERLDVE